MTIFYFKLKGARSYVHGTDIFASMIKHSTAKLDSTIIQNLDFQIHKMMHSHLELEEYTGDNIVKDNTFSTTFSFRQNDVRTTYVLRETGERVTERYEYDEEKIKDCARLDSDRSMVSFSRPEGFSPIESIVAANKHLLQELRPEYKVKWLFGRLQVESYDSNDRFDEFQMVCEKSLGHRLVKTAIHLRGRPWGKIFFSGI